MTKFIFLTLSFLLALNSVDAFAKMRLKSNDIRSGRTMSEKHVFNSFGCTGDNQSPQLILHNVPKNAKSLAITMYDPDAPTGSGWWHWIVYDIDPDTKEIVSGAKEISENAIVARNDYGTFDYGGPCPPIKTSHRYIFTLYALDVEKLDLPKGASAAMIGYNLNKHKLKKFELTSLYSRR